VETFTNQGFSGNFKLMVGFAPDGTIIDIAVIQHSETPGLGSKMEKGKSDFSLQFKGKNPATFKLAVKKDRGDVDAITASTITSRAYCDAVARAYRAFMESQKAN
jgi:electron transport complex protein RnfG